MQAYIDRGFYIGLTGFVAMQKRGQQLRSFLQKIPLHRLMVETDGPYMLPDHVEGCDRSGIDLLKSFRKHGRNEPCCLPLIVASMASYLGISMQELAVQLTQNTKQFFNLP
eukprot:TRINITY_DN7936_c0_g3_i3.p1 TRINITY_DN7936_c0_g3~~TRINITY_DN7936_c0_g3_i3.p1  ORF type:complete len:111 (+),score=7.46 TRINITY_DN7936_c0_g3_i3:553-885(+)